MTTPRVLDREGREMFKGARVRSHLPPERDYTITAVGEREHGGVPYIEIEPQPCRLYAPFDDLTLLPDNEKEETPR